MEARNAGIGQKIPMYKTVVLALIIMAVIMVVSAGACLLFYWNTAASERYRVQVQQNAALNIAEQLVFTSLQAVIGDLQFLSSQNEVKALLGQNSARVKSELAAEYLALARHKGIYDQVRFLNAHGQEVVRVNYNGGDPYIVPADELQNKQGRYYFTEAANAPPGSVYISTFDLNVENGEVEQPIKPMIRFSLPIFSDGGNFLGAIVLNYLGKQVLDDIRNDNRFRDGDMMLVNADGYWLLSPNPTLEWGFMRPERDENLFSRSFSSEWRRIATGERGQFSTANGLFAYKAIFPGRLIANYRNCIVKTSQQSQKWLLIHYLSKEALYQGQSTLRKNLFILWAVMAIFAIGPAWLLASVFIKRRLTQHQVWRMANFDALTGLFNRSSLMHELNQAVAEGERYKRKFVLMYIDLDGFKEINDTLGHAAGDLLLQQTAARFLASLRTSDCVARLGGDELCIIAREIDTSDKAAHVAGKLIDVLAAPFDLDGKKGRIGASIGIARFPDDSTTVDGLLKMADDAMYAAKNGGKNQYYFPLVDQGSEPAHSTDSGEMN